ncbi:hypothetical protein [Streptomyces sp. NPDC101165]|uniref:hypothetical protein n=1 Tax=Streptomyces sp. NPDC101165 TaxID=3366119 RepID=UPI0038023D3D
MRHVDCGQEFDGGDDVTGPRLGVPQLSKSQVGVVATHLDEQVTAFRNGPPDTGPYAFVLELLLQYFHRFAAGCPAVQPQGLGAVDMAQLWGGCEG